MIVRNLLQQAPTPLPPSAPPSSSCSHSFLSSFCRPIVCLCQSCQPHPQLTGAAAFVCCNRSVINTRLTVHFAWPESVQQRRLQHATRRLEKRTNQRTNERTNCALSEMLKCIITVHFAHKHTHTPIHTPTLSHLDSLKLIFALRFSIYFFFSFAAFNVARILFALIDS